MTDTPTLAGRLRLIAAENFNVASQNWERCALEEAANILASHPAPEGETEELVAEAIKRLMAQLAKPYDEVGLDSERAPFCEVRAADLRLALSRLQAVSASFLFTSARFPWVAIRSVV
jgi:hypothetical protein